MYQVQVRSFSVFRTLKKHQEFGSTIKEYINNPVKLLVIPITNRKSYFYFKYSNELLNNDSRLIRYETKLANKAAKIWQNMQESDKSYNKKIVAWITKLLDRIPWTESSLQTIPSESYILKRIESGSKTNVTFHEYERAKNDSSVVSMKPKPICVYFPKSILNESTINKQLKELADAGQQYHKKYAALCAVGIPITFPLILVPVVPNVPGFYLAYRLYCNAKAYFGAKHLESLIKSEDQTLEMRNLVQYSDILQGANSMQARNEREEVVLLRESDLDRILDSLEIHEISTDLRKAIRQETSRLECQSKD